MSFPSDCNLSLLMLLLFQSLVDFGFFDPVTKQANGSIKDLCSSEKARGQNKEWLTENKQERKCVKAVHDLKTLRLPWWDKSYRSPLAMANTIILIIHS